MKFTSIFTSIIAVVCLLGLAMSQLSAASIWVEGEDASHNAFKKHSWYDNVKKEALSGGEWICHFKAGTQGQASWDVEVAEAGKYALWIRLNPSAGAKYQYQINSGEWTDFDCNANIRGEMNLAADEKHDMRFVAWSKVGKIDLPAGAVKFSLKTLSESNNHGAVDCMVFTNDGFTPSGLDKPGAATGEVSSKPADVKDAIWIEAEDSNTRNIKPHGWYGGVVEDFVSGGILLNHWHDSKGSASYNFNVAEADAFILWARINPFECEMTYAIDGAAAEKIPMTAVRDKLNVAKGGAHDMRFLAWVKIGKFDLETGDHSIVFHFTHS
ncbi:MAG: hypothetical protein HRU15_16805, partial [Planctomycetes bacterium]|nr:hypothetical protein [Planctomycetota bacterium]